MKTLEPIVTPAGLTDREAIQHFNDRFGPARDQKHRDAALEHLDDAWQAVDNAVTAFVDFAAPDTCEELLLEPLPRRCAFLTQHLPQCECNSDSRGRAERVVDRVLWIAGERDRILSVSCSEPASLWALTEVADHLRETHIELHATLCEIFPDFKAWMKPTHDKARRRESTETSPYHVAARKILGE